MKRVASTGLQPDPCPDTPGTGYLGGPTGSGGPQACPGPRSWGNWPPGPVATSGPIKPSRVCPGLPSCVHWNQEPKLGTGYPRSGPARPGPVWSRPVRTVPARAGAGRAGFRKIRRQIENKSKNKLNSSQNLPKTSQNHLKIILKLS